MCIFWAVYPLWSALEVGADSFKVGKLVFLVFIYIFQKSVLIIYQILVAGLTMAAMNERKETKYGQRLVNDVFFLHPGNLPAFHIEFDFESLYTLFTALSTKKMCMIYFQSVFLDYIL